MPRLPSPVKGPGDVSWGTATRRTRCRTGPCPRAEGRTGGGGGLPAVLDANAGVQETSHLFPSTEERGHLAAVNALTWEGVSHPPGLTTAATARRHESHGRKISHTPTTAATHPRLACQVGPPGGQRRVMPDVLTCPDSRPRVPETIGRRPKVFAPSGKPGPEAGTAAPTGGSDRR